MTQAYKEKTGTEQGTKVEATEKEAVGCKARAEPGSAGTRQTSSVSPRGLRDSSSSCFKALGKGMSTLGGAPAQQDDAMCHRPAGIAG